MRVLALVALVVLSASCTCGGCQRVPATIDAGAPEVIVEAAAKPSAVLAATTAPSDGGVPLPWVVTEFGPSREAVIAAFAADCRHEVSLDYEDMAGAHDGGECLAREMEQNCSPDTFGCWGKLQACKDRCAAPCTSCQSVCGASCESCKTHCDGGTCITECAITRNDCRLACLAKVESCRAQNCLTESDTCEADAEARRKRLCPHCENIFECLSQAILSDGDPSLCGKKYPNDAAECLEWCAPGE